MAASRARAGPRSTARSSARSATSAKRTVKMPPATIMRRDRARFTAASPPAPSRHPACRAGGARCPRCARGRAASRSRRRAPGARARVAAASGAPTTARSRASPSAAEATRGRRRGRPARPRAGPCAAAALASAGTYEPRPRRGARGAAGCAARGAARRPRQLSPAPLEPLDDPQLCAARPRVPRDLGRTGTNGPAGREPDLRAPSAHAARQRRRTEAGRSPAPERLLHASILERVVRQDRHPSSGTEDGVSVGQEPVERAELIVHRDAEGLERTGGGMKGEAWPTDRPGDDLGEVARRRERTGPHDRARDGPRPPLLAVLRDDPDEVRLRPLVHEVGGGERAARVHAHVERALALEGGPALGGGQLERAEP